MIVSICCGNFAEGGEGVEKELGFPERNEVLRAGEAEAPTAPMLPGSREGSSSVRGVAASPA